MLSSSDIHPTPTFRVVVASEYCIFAHVARTVGLHWECGRCECRGGSSLYLCPCISVCRAPSHAIRKGRLFWALFTKAQRSFLQPGIMPTWAAASAGAGRPSAPPAPAARCVSLQGGTSRGFHLGCDQTPLQTWKELNVLGFFKRWAWGAFGVTHPPPTPCLFPNGVLAKSISSRQVTHWNLCSKPKV